MTKSKVLPGMLSVLDEQLEAVDDEQERVKALTLQHYQQVAATFTQGPGIGTLQELRETTIERPVAINQRFDGEPMQEDLFMAYRAGQNSIVLTILRAIKLAEEGR